MRPSTYPILDSVVLDTIQASAADLILSKGTLSVKGLATAIPMRDVFKMGFTKYAYAAGTAKVGLITIGSIAANTAYTVQITTYYTQGIPLSSAAEKYTETKSYVVYTGASTTATQAATQLAALINADTSSFVTATPSTNTVSIAGGDANATFVITVSDTSIFVVTTTTPYVQPQGTYAIVSKVNPNALSGSTYATYIWTIKTPIPGKSLNSQGNDELVGEVIIYANEAATNFAAFNTEMLAIQAGTHSPSADYLGVNAVS